MAFKVRFKQLNINWSTWFKGRKKVIEICDHLTLKVCRGVYWGGWLQGGLRCSCRLSNVGDRCKVSCCRQFPGLGFGRGRQLSLGYPYRKIEGRNETCGQPHRK